MYFKQNLHTWPRSPGSPDVLSILTSRKSLSIWAMSYSDGLMRALSWTHSLRCSYVISSTLSTETHLEITSNFRTDFEIEFRNAVSGICTLASAFFSATLPSYVARFSLKMTNLDVLISVSRGASMVSTIVCRTVLVWFPLPMLLELSAMSLATARSAITKRIFSR